MTISVDLIIVPQGAEAKAVKSGLQHCGLVDSPKIITIPIGSNNLTKTLTAHAQKLSTAKQVIILGLCGSLNKSYGIGDTVAISSCHNQFQQQVSLDPVLTAQIQQILSVDAVASLTSDRIITQVKEKIELGQQSRTSIVEMEGYYLVELLQQQGIAVAMVRVVSDDLTGNIPDLSQAVTPEGNLEPFPLAIAMIKQPRAAISLIKGSLRGLKALKQATVRLFSNF